jgi:hypothetical protein
MSKQKFEGKKETLVDKTKKEVHYFDITFSYCVK